MAAFPYMHALRKIGFNFGMTPPAIVLFAASSAPCVHTLEFTALRIDDPFVIQSFFNFPHLKSLSMSNNGRNRNTDDVREKELSNVSYILRTLSEQLYDLEISGGLVEFSTLMATDWPRLRTLNILDHIPQGPVVPLSSFLSRMPSLKTLSYSFAIQPVHDADPFHLDRYPQKYEPQPITGQEHISLPPKLISVNLANPPSQYPIFDFLPAGLESLRVLFRPLKLPSIPGVHVQVPPGLYESESFYYITEASRFTYLRELSLTLEAHPTTAILSKIAKECPSISILEVGCGVVSLNEPAHDIVSSP